MTTIIITDVIVVVILYSCWQQGVADWATHGSKSWKCHVRLLCSPLQYSALHQIDAKVIFPFSFLSCKAVWAFACRQLAEAPEGGGPKGKKGKAKKGKGKKGEKGKEDKGKGKEKEKGKKEKDDGEGAEAPVIQAVGKHFSLDLSQEQHRAVACLLAVHELQVGLIIKIKIMTTLSSSWWARYVRDKVGLHLLFPPLSIWALPAPGESDSALSSTQHMSFTCSRQVWFCSFLHWTCELYLLQDGIRSVGWLSLGSPVYNLAFS